MKIEVVQIVDRDTIRVTTTDERWYRKIEDVEKQWYPSTTWITSSHPKNTAFWKWLASKGWDEAERLKVAGGNRGSKVHKAIEAALRFQPVSFDSRFGNGTGIDDELTSEEYECFLAFCDWYDAFKPKILAIETVVFSPESVLPMRYAGTVDFVCEIKGQVYIVDFKTSQNIWPEYRLQLSAYKHALSDYKNVKLAILQVGVRANKHQKWRFTEVEDEFDLFAAVYKIWESEYGSVTPYQRDYPRMVLLTNYHTTEGSTNETAAVSDAGTGTPKLSEENIPENLVRPAPAESRRRNARSRKTRER